MMFYVAYLDEFGHIGPYLAHDHPKHKTHPVFGLGGVLLPFPKIRDFSTFFYQRKNELLKYELEKSGVAPPKWEKKGASLYTRHNIETYPELRRATFRVLNKIRQCQGRVFYVGVEKERSLENQNAKGLYSSVLRECIKRLDQECEEKGGCFMLILDQSDDKMRTSLVETASMSMYGSDPRKRLVEPPIQAESHLYQTLQCADWICGILGRLSKYWCEPHTYADLAPFDKYFHARLRSCRIRSSIRKLD